MSLSKLFLSALSLIVLSTTVSFAAEVKAEQGSGIVKLLDSKIAAIAKAKDIEKKEKAKKKMVLPEPNKEDMKAEADARDVEGVIVARNNSGMAVEYEFDPVTATSKEIWFNFHSKAKLTGARSFFDLRENDMVRVSYKITKKTQHLLLDKVTFLGKKPVEPVLAEPVEASQ